MKRPAYDQTSLTHCKECGAKLDKAKLKGNRCMACHAADNTRRKRAKRRALIEMLGDKCSDCGQQFPDACYDFHHEGDKVDDVARLINHNRSLDFLKEEALKCILLCANCHRLRHYT